MTTPDMTAKYLAALAERFGFEVALDADHEVEIEFDATQPVMVRFDEKAGTLTVIAPIAAATDGLPSYLLEALLVRNAPNADMAGAHLAARPGAGMLEMRNVFAIDSIAPVAFARIVAAQANAAIQLSGFIDTLFRRGQPLN